MKDETEEIRRELVAEINENAGERTALEADHGQVWGTKELGRDFDVTGFMAPFCIVKRRADGVVGTVTFQHSPRYYFSFLGDRS